MNNEGAEGDRPRNQSLGFPPAEHLGGKGIDGEHDHEQRHAAVGEQAADGTMDNMARSRPTG